MQIALLKNLISDLANPESTPIIDILVDKKDVNEFLIAKKMNLTINQVRNILYKLSAEGLVSFTRKKDKRKGWYIYFWTLNIEKCLLKIEGEWMKRIEELRQLLRERETKRYYICKGCNIEVNEEKALEEDFSCSECAEVYTLVDNTNIIKELKGRITKKENELKNIRMELEETRRNNAVKKEKEAKSHSKKKNHARTSAQKRKTKTGNKGKKPLNKKSVSKKK